MSNKDTYRVLVASNSPHSRQACLKRLVDAGLEVEFTSIEANGTLSDISGCPSAVIYDLESQQKAGSDSNIVKLLRNTPELREAVFVFFSIHALRPEQASALIAPGVSDLVQGPVEDPALAYRVNALISLNRELDSLKNREKKYRVLAENTLDVIWRMDESFCFTYVNKAISKLTGHLPEEVLGSSIFSHIPIEKLTGFMKRVKMVQDRRFATGDPGDGSLGDGAILVGTELTRKDGSLVSVEIHSRPIFRSGQIVGYQGTTRDVTESKVLREQLQQSQKMEAIGRLAGGVAHDFNNLLTVIGNYTELMIASVRLDDPMRQDLLEVQTAANRAAELTNQLLTFSRKQHIKPVVIDVNETIERSEKMLRRLIGEDIDLRFLPSRSPSRVLFDPGQLEQVLFNLAVNARDAMPQGGALTIKTEKLPTIDDTRRARLQVESRDLILLTVSDNGCGMTEETLQNAFEPFYTTKEEGRGTGLGLSTVYGIVKQHGGTIKLRSELGAGTTSLIYLPTTAQEIKAGDELDAEEQRGGETILLIEDQPDVRSVTQRVLEKAGYTLLIAGHPDEAIELARAKGREIDLVLTDVIMPQMNGRECYEKLQPLAPEMRVLFMSGYPGETILSTGVCSESSLFLQKPFTIEALRSKVRQALDA